MTRCNHTLRCGLLLACLAFVSIMRAQKIPYDNKLVMGTLSNGLTYYVYPNDNPKGILSAVCQIGLCR